MSNWGISENASEKEKLKAKFNDYLHGQNATGSIDWIAYNELYDAIMPILDRAYERMHKEESEQPNNEAVNNICDFNDGISDPTYINGIVDCSDLGIYPWGNS